MAKSLILNAAIYEYFICQRMHSDGDRIQLGHSLNIVLDTLQGVDLLGDSLPESGIVESFYELEI